MLPFGQLWYTHVSDAVDYAKFYSRSYDAVIGVHDDAGNVIETHEPVRSDHRETIAEIAAATAALNPKQQTGFLSKLDTSRADRYAAPPQPIRKDPYSAVPPSV